LAAQTRVRCLDNAAIVADQYGQGFGGASMLCMRQRQPQLGLVVHRELEALPQSERLPFLARVEQRARSEGDLPMLRAIKEYRALHHPAKAPVDD
jgi:hypothetical protein